MKKVVFLFAAMAVIGVPAWAVVNITAIVKEVEIGGSPADTDTVAIIYENTEPNAIRAFGIDITVEPPTGDPCADPHIVDVCGLNNNYWVYPGSIDINEAGEVNAIGTPVGDPCVFPSDTLGGLDTNGITIEMGSLYVGEANAPASSGVLLKFVVNDNCKVNLSDNVSRGGVVMEGGGAPSPGGTVNYLETTVQMYTHTDIAQWRAVGRPKCWCRFKGGRQCHGDADGLGEMKTPYYVYTRDLNVLLAGWMKPYSDMVNPDGSHKTVLLDGWWNVAWICADFDHASQLKQNYRVYTYDLDILLANWQQDRLPAPTCP